eukprot:m.206925 g.206925  ORF g.206925 m.206925 type:complete len:231 (-) comp18910_c2_seq3:190-882(-)
MGADSTVSDVAYATATVVDPAGISDSCVGDGSSSFVPSWISAMPGHMPLGAHDFSDAANAASEALSFLHRESVSAASAMHSGVIPNPMDRLKQLTLSPSNSFDLDPIAGIKEALNKATDKICDSSTRLAAGLFGGLLGVGVIVALGIVVAAYIVRPPYEDMHEEFMARYMLQQQDPSPCEVCGNNGRGRHVNGPHKSPASAGTASCRDGCRSPGGDGDSAEVFGGIVTEL